MQTSYIQLNKNGRKVYKPVIGMVVRTSTLPQSFEKILPNSTVRSINEIWQVDRDIYTGKMIKTLLWQRTKLVEICTELGNSLPTDPPGEKYFIREDPVGSGDTIKEDKNAIHIPIDSEEFVHVAQNYQGEDIIVR